MAEALTYRLNLDRRSRKERRRYRHHSVLKQLVVGQRASVRRREDLNKIFYLDRYETTILVGIIAILILSLTDALLTLLLIEYGAVEVNPLMDFYLKISPHLFVFVKYMLTSLSVFILAVFSHMLFSRMNIRIHSVLSLIACAFLSVIAWQVYLIAKVLL